MPFFYKSCSGTFCMFQTKELHLPVTVDMSFQLSIEQNVVNPVAWPFYFRWMSVYLFGELTKWVPMSPKRVTNIEISDDLYVTLVGAVEETVNFSFSLDPSSITTVSCNLGLTRTAVIGVIAKSCRSVWCMLNAITHHFEQFYTSDIKWNAIKI